MGHFIECTLASSSDFSEIWGRKAKMYKADDEYAILPLTAPAWSSLENQGTNQDLFWVENDKQLQE